MAVEAASVSTFESVVGGLTVAVVSDYAVVAILFDLVRDDYRSRVSLLGDHSCFLSLACLSLHSIHASLSLVAYRHFSRFRHGSSSSWSLFDCWFSFRHRFSS